MSLTRFKRKKKKKYAYSPEKRQRSYVKTREDPELYEIHLAGNLKSRKLIRAWLAKYKTDRGCQDCGYRGHSSALQLDHTGEKSIEIADARSSVARLRDEIKNGKCVVRCANCHSVKTWAEKNGIAYSAGMSGMPNVREEGK